MRSFPTISVGGNQTCQVTMHNLDKFAYIRAFSGTMNGLSTAALDPGTAFNSMFKEGEVLNKQIKLLWIGMGTAEPNPFPGAIGAFRAMLDRAGIRCVLLRVARDRSRMVDMAAWTCANSSRVCSGIEQLVD